MTKKITNIGVIGVGGMGAQHARNLAHHIAGVKVSAVMDIDEASLQLISAACGGSKIYTDGYKLIEDDNVDAVVIASPDQTHADLTLACLAVGKPVLCEKPLATNAVDAEKVFRAEVDKGKQLIQVGFMREYDDSHRKLKSILDSGNIGAPLLFHGFHYNMSIGVERNVDDVITNSAIHDIHSAHWLMGQEIVKVYTQYIPHDSARPKNCRLLTLDLTFRNGTLGIIQVNVDSGYGYEVNVEITAESGQVTTHSLTSPVVRRKGRFEQTIERDWLDRFDAAYLNEIRTWSKAVTTGGFDGPTAWDGYTSLVVADACKQSAVSRQAVDVALADRPAFYQAR